MKHVFSIIAAIFCISCTVMFTGCQQDDEQKDNITVTLHKDELAEKHSYWYKVSGTMTLTAGEESYETTITTNDMYVSWEENTYKKSNYNDYTLNLKMDYYNPISNSQIKSDIAVSCRGTANKKKYENGNICIDGDITSNSFSCTISYPQLYTDYSGTYKRYDAVIKLNCTKI